MEYLIYISTAKKLLDESELTDILNTSRRNNLEHNVTGILLYSEGTFIQLLEGEAESVNTIYDKIVKDTRHKNIIKLTHTAIDKRCFPNWTMGFKTLDTTDMGKLEGYFNPNHGFHDHDASHPGIAVIRSFTESNMTA